MKKDVAVELDLNWQALRYAVDMIDLAWSYPETEGDYTRTEMQAHRDRLLKMQELTLKGIRFAEKELKS